MLEKYNVNYFVPLVQKKLGNRQDIVADAPLYIRQALLEITRSDKYDFEELKVTGQVTQFQTGVSSYDKNFFCNENDELCKVVTWFVYLVPISGLNPTGQANVGYIKKGRDVGVVEAMANIPGIPSLYAQHGEQLIVGAQPNNTYATYMRYQRVHPFSKSPSQWPGDTVYLPPDWEEIIAVSAAFRLAYDKRMFDYASALKQYLYGDPESKELGVMDRRVTQQELMTTRNERQLRPVVRRTT